MTKRLCSVPAHWILLAAGFVFLLTDAFHGNIWFDETYSVAIARYPFDQIWTIDSSDVHPVLFYWALHVLYLIFGTNLVAYRVFTVCGAWALALLGFTHMRRDFGPRAGVWFTFLALFMPYIPTMAVQIRMYSWATFAVTLCALSAWRIAKRLRSEDAKPLVPAGLWAAFFLSSLASAYLHYFGALSAFMVNLFLLVYLVRRGRGGLRQLAVFLVGAVAQVLVYLPWLFAAVISQLGVVGNTYWANPVWPTSYIEHATYPIVTSYLSFALRGENGPLVALIAQALMVLLVVATAAVAVCLVRKVRALTGRDGLRACVKGALSHDAARAALLGVMLYVSVYLLGLIAGIVLNSYIMYYRYLFVTMGPWLVFLALVLSRVDEGWLRGAVCAVLLCAAVLNQAILMYDDYSPDNQAPLTYFEQTYQETCEAAASEAAASEAAASETTTPEAAQSKTDQAVSVPVLSSDIGVISITSLAYQGIPQTYMDWQPGNWNAGYLCYAPTLSITRNWETTLDGYHGYFVVLGQSTGSQARDVHDLAAKDGVSLVSERLMFRPYERTYFDVAVMYKQ